MADFSQPLAFDKITERADINTGTSGSMRDTRHSTDDLSWNDTHDAHWREQHASRPYVRADRGYEHYQPAYRYGHDAAHRHHGRDWTDVEPALERGWQETHGSTGSPWTDMKHAARDAFDRARGR